MCKKLLLTPLIVVCLFLLSSAQTPLFSPNYSDSLQNLLQQNLPDTSKARICFLLSNYWILKDTIQAKGFIDKGKALGGNNTYTQQLANGAEGYYYYYTNDLLKCEAAYKKVEAGLLPFTTSEAYALRSNAWSTRASLFQRNDDDKGFIEIMLNNAIPLALKANDSALVSSQYTKVGVAFMNLDQNEKAEEYFNKAIPILTRQRSYARLMSTYNRAGENYVLLKKWDKVKEVLTASKEILAQYPGSEYYAGYYMVQGLYLQQLKDFRGAITNFNKGIEKANGPNKSYVILELNYYKVKSLLDLKQYKEAKKVLNLLSSDEENMSLDQNKLEVYQRYAETYAGLKQMDSAFQYQKMYSAISDSLHESSFRLDINEMEAMFKTSEAQKQVVALKADKAQAALKANRNYFFNWLLVGACFLFLSIAAFSFFYYQNNKKLLLQKEINHRQQLTEMEQRQELAITRSILEGEERERVRVARDLHDGLGGLLAGVKLNFSTWAITNLKSDQNEPFHRIMGQLDHSVDELRRVARNLMPQSLLEFGLETALKDLCDFYMKSGLVINFQSLNISSSIEKSKQIHIYRICQELISNTIRHANAHTIMLQCSQSSNKFFITMEDDGIGFNANRPSTNKGMGIENMRNRVTYLDGIFDITSAPGEGTTVNIELVV